MAVGNNPLYTQRELEHQIKDAGINVMVVLENVYEKFGKVRTRRASARSIVGEAHRLHAVPDEAAGAASRSGKTRRRRASPGRPSRRETGCAGGRMRWTAPARRRRSRRSTRRRSRRADLHGRNDRAVQGRHALRTSTWSRTRCRRVAWISDIRPGKDAIMCILPFFHSFGTVAMNVGSPGGEARDAAALRPEAMPEGRSSGRSRRSSRVCRGSTSRSTRRQETRKYDLGSIKACISGAAPLPLAVAEKFERITGGRRSSRGTA